MDIIIKLYKSIGDGYEITTVYSNGNVEIKLSKLNAESKFLKIDFVEDFKKQLKDAYNIMLEVYCEEKNESFCVRYNNHDFYSFDLYTDIMIMIKHNKLKKLSVYEKYEKIKKAQEEKKVVAIVQNLLDELEKNKTEIDILSVDEKIDDQRNIISFGLRKKNEFLIGETRFFSDTIDICKSIDYPKYLEFVGQINLDDISKYDNRDLLPKNGMLYFFQSPFCYNGKYYNFGKVIYCGSNEEIVREKIKTFDDDLIMNLGIDSVKSCIECFSDRYEIDDGKKIYNSTKNDELNKIYGFYTDCQLSDIDIKKISNKYVVLLQLGSEMFGEGVTTFLIKEEDLKNKNFDNVIYQYVQT